MEKLSTNTKLIDWMNTINSSIDNIDNVNLEVETLTTRVDTLPKIISSIDELSSSPDGLYWLKSNSSEDCFSRLPLGHVFTWPFQTPPDGSIIANGSEYNRELYKDLWEYVNSHLTWVKTEEEWQEIASSNNGYCSYYSTGDGTTTFRTPKFAPFQQLSGSSDSVGIYHEAGIPEISGNASAMLISNNNPVVSGAFSITGGGNTFVNGQSSSGTYKNTVFSIKASSSSSIYGKSTTVQPESNEWIVCIVAYGIVTNTGSVDISNIMSTVNSISDIYSTKEEVNLKLSNYLRSTGDTMTGSLLLKAPNPIIAEFNNNITKGTTPDTNYTSQIKFCDKDGNLTGAIINTYLSDGSIKSALISVDPDSTNKSELSILWKNNAACGYAPSPSLEATGIEITTASWVNSKLNNYLPLTGGTVSGRININDVGRIGDNNNYVYLTAITESEETGAFLSLKNSLADGSFDLSARNGTVLCSLTGTITGNLNWNGKNIVRSVNNVDADTNGNVTLSSVTNSTQWNGSSKTVSTASASGGANGDIWFQYI